MKFYGYCLQNQFNPFGVYPWSGQALQGPQRSFYTQKMKSKKNKPTNQIQKPTKLHHSRMLTPEELQFLKQDFYEAAKYLNIPKAEDFNPKNKI